MRFQLGLAAAAALFVGSAGLASAQGAGGYGASGYGGGEYIVDAQVISDEVVGELVGEAVAGSNNVGVAGRAYGRPDLFYNYYTQGNRNRVHAQMYLAPRPVPPNVGHTFTTYQPFMPHEMLYKHTDRYHNYYDGGRGMNRTKARYYYPPVRQAASNFYWNMLRIPR